MSEMICAVICASSFPRWSHVWTFELRKSRSKSSLDMRGHKCQRRFVLSSVPTHVRGGGYASGQQQLVLPLQLPPLPSFSYVHNAVLQLVMWLSRSKCRAEKTRVAGQTRVAEQTITRVAEQRRPEWLSRPSCKANEESSG